MAYSTLQEVKRKLSGKDVFLFHILEPFPQVNYMAGVDNGIIATNIVMSYRHQKFRDPAGSFKIGGEPQTFSNGQIAQFKNPQNQAGMFLGGGEQATFWTASDIRSQSFNQGYPHTETIPSFNFSTIQDLLKQNYSPMIAIDLDAQGNPGCYAGANVQWCVILGVANYKNGEKYVIATHSWGGFYIWDYESLLRSNAQLLQIPQQIETKHVANGAPETNVTAGKSLSDVKGKLVVLRRIAGIY